MEILMTVGLWVLPIVATALTLLLAGLAKKYIGKLGVERSEAIDFMIDKYVGIGVRAAKVAAEVAVKNRVEMSGSSKKGRAVGTVLRELEQSGVKGVAAQLIGDRIEAYLDLNPDAKVKPFLGESGEAV